MTKFACINPLFNQSIFPLHKYFATKRRNKNEVKKPYGEQQTKKKRETYHQNSFAFIVVLVIEKH